MMRLPLSKVPRMLGVLAEHATVYAPIVEDGVVLLKPWSGGQPAREYIISENSLKDVVFPQTETVFSFDGGAEDVSLSEDSSVSRRVVFGGRPCDAAALDQVARVFLEGEFTDEAFRRMRENTSIITVACNSSDGSCFCTAMGVSPADSRGSDLILYPMDDGYAVCAVTDRGRDMMAAVKDLLCELDEDEGEEARRVAESTEIPAAARLDMEELGEVTDDLFDHPYWRDVSDRCHSCGVCAYVCPTCHCFAMFDAVRGSAGWRMRGWDSCQFEDFMLMAGGHNPRPTKTERVRQRFMHKLRYHPSNYGEYGCTGCGRCVRKCPVGLHMLAVISEIGGVV